MSTTTRADEAGLNVKALEENQDLHDAVLTTHHAFTLTFAHRPAIKIIENHEGVAMVEAFAGP